MTPVNLGVTPGAHGYDGAVLLMTLLAVALPPLGGTVLRTGGIALAVGLDVLALSTGIGVLGVPWSVRLRVGAAFASAEIVMQILGAAIGAGAGRIAGDVAAYLGFGLLAAIGGWIFWASFREDADLSEKATSGLGLCLASASISLDSLGVGFSLPALRIPLVPLVGTVAVSTLVFTFAGLRFGELLGRRFKQRAERAAGSVLVALAIVFAMEHVAR